jgi:hypothetical protein
MTGIGVASSNGCVLIEKFSLPRASRIDKTRVNTNDYSFVTDIYTKTATPLVSPFQEALVWGT